MRAKVLALLGVLIVAGAVTFGVNSALGDPPTPQIIPKEPKPESTPEPFPPGATPVTGLSVEPSLPVCNWPDPDAPPRPFKLNEPCFTDPNTEVPNVVPLPGKEDKFFPLPPGANWSTVHNEYAVGEGPPPGWPQDYNAVTMGDSLVLFTFDGVILNSHIAPEDEQALEPLLSELTKR